MTCSSCSKRLLLSAYHCSASAVPMHFRFDQSLGFHRHIFHVHLGRDGEFLLMAFVVRRDFLIRGFGGGRELLGRNEQIIHHALFTQKVIPVAASAGSSQTGAVSRRRFFRSAGCCSCPAHTGARLCVARPAPACTLGIKRLERPEKPCSPNGMPQFQRRHGNPARSASGRERLQDKIRKTRRPRCCSLSCSRVTPGLSRRMDSSALR